MYNFDLPFEAIVPGREEWGTGGPYPRAGSLDFNTDGWKKDGLGGIGVYGPFF